VGDWLKYKGLGAAAGLGLLAGGPAFAAQPVDRGLDLQPPATAVMAEIRDFHQFVLVIITAITVLVLALLLWVMVRYNRRVNPEPKKFTHNVLVEVVWTIVPVLILVAIAIPSFQLLAREERIPEADITIKAIGNSWYWQHEYPDYDVAVTSNMLPVEEARAENRPALLAVDQPIYVPVGKTVRLLVTSNDVIHSWTIPAFGVKEDAIPGRVNEGWFNVQNEGVYYGQCSELCGIRHAFMPIEVRAVSQEAFDRWILEQGGQLAMAEPAPAEPAPAPAALSAPEPAAAPAVAAPPAAPAPAPAPAEQPS
jgi:cytochrome c oxidase subunit 2